MRGWYAVLGVAESASRAEITRAYRLAAMRWHPDRNVGREAEADARFKQLGEARAVLLDPARRAAHDLALDMARGSFEPPTARESFQRPAGPSMSARPAAMPRVSAAWGAGSAAPRAAPAGRRFWAAGLALLIALGTLWWWAESLPTGTAMGAPAASNWGGLLPPAVTHYDERTGVGLILHAALPAGTEFDRLRRDVGKPFRLQLLQALPLPDARRLLLFVSAPPGFDCRACHPLLSAMVVRQRGEQGAQVVLPLQVVSTAGSDGALALEGDREARLFDVGPNREGFYFREKDGELGATAEWGNLFAIESDRVRFLGSVHVHSESASDGACGGSAARPCVQLDTKIRFSKEPGPSGFYDLLATEVDTDPSRERRPVIERSYTLRFDGQRYSRFGPRGPAAQGTLGPVHTMDASALLPEKP